MDALWPEIKNAKKDAISLKKQITFYKADLYFESAQKELWEATQSTKNTFFIIKTNFNKIIGGYVPFAIKQAKGQNKIPADNSFRFYFTDINELKVLLRNKNYDEWMKSDEETLFGLRSIQISKNREKSDTCWSSY